MQPWHALRTRYRFERKVVSQLQRKGIVTFLPLLEQVHRWSDRHKKIQVPLFPGYVFVEAKDTTEKRLEILRTCGVLGVVGGCAQTAGAEVPAQQIADLRRLLEQKTPCALYPFLQSGQRVRIRGGCLDGLEGILSKNGTQELVISIQCIERSVAVQLKGYELEVI